MKIYLRILEFAKPYRFYIILSIFASFLYVITNGLSLWIIGSLLSSVMSGGAIINDSVSPITFTDKINRLIFSFIDTNNKIELLKFLSIMLLVSFLFKNIFFYINNIALSYAQNGMIKNIRESIFEKYQNLSISFFKQRKSSVLTSIIIHDVNILKTTFTQTVQNLFNQPLNVIFCIIMLFLINVNLAMISFIIIPLSAYITLKLGSSIRRKALRSSKQIAELMNIVIENINGIKIVKAFTGEKNEIAKFNKEGKGLFNKEFRLDSLRFLTTPVNDMIGAMIGAVLLWVGGKQVLISYTLTGDGFIKFFTFLFSMFTPAKKLAGVSVEINRGIASAERVFDILDNKEVYDNNNKCNIDGFSNSIEFKDASFAYENNNNVLNKINIKINKGEFIALVGESGAGKTTFADLIPRYYSIKNGEILFDGININDINIRSLREKIGIVPQDSILFNDTIYNNIKYGNLSSSKKEILQAAEIANATDFITSFQNKFDTYIGEKGTKISGGQKQRIAIARAIIKNPEILILDEATSALDSKSEVKINDAINKISKTKTIIVIAHRLSTIKNADRILFFKKGEIIESGNHNDLYNLKGEYFNLYNVQFSKN
tara:strand:- start:3368 stop:5176 length:1809 start_codon:yes stop_codon:yes gene_type:complete